MSGFSFVKVQASNKHFFCAWIEPEEDQRLEKYLNSQHFSEIPRKSPRQSRQAGIPFLGVRGGERVRQA